jgi:hypothetical protein
MLLLFVSCSHTKVGRTQHCTQLTTAYEARAGVVLEQYLLARDEGQDEESMRFLTKRLLKHFDEVYGGYVVFHRTDEDFFTDPKILDLKHCDDGTILAEVSVVVTGIDYRHPDAREQYRMVHEGNSWKIDDWTIDYGEGDEWPYDD